MNACIAIGGTCREPAIAGWKYCSRHLQVDQVAAVCAELRVTVAELRAERHNLRRRIRLARAEIRGLCTEPPRCDCDVSRAVRLLDLRRPLPRRKR